MTRTFHQYSVELKQRLVAEVEAGRMTLREAASDARATVTLVRTWLEEYGQYRPKREIVEVVMRSEQDQIAALEKAVAEAHLKLAVAEELIVQANTFFKTDIKKNFGAGRSMPSRPARPGAPSVRSAASSASPATPTTNASAGAPSRAARRTR